MNLWFAGQSNPELTRQGELQAKALCDWIVSKFKIDAIYSSDLSRAYNTVKPLSERLNIEIIKDINLREIHAGDWAGCSFKRIIQTYGEDYSVWLNDIGNARCTNGESVRELAQRVVGEMEKIASLENGKTVVISTHATPIRAFQTVCQKGDISLANSVPWTANASITVCEYNGKFGFKLIGYNDYLEDLKSQFPSSVV